MIKTQPAWDLVEQMFVRFRAGDPEVFKELAKRHSGGLRSHLRRYSRSAADIEDVLQETWLRAWIQRDSFRGDGPAGGDQSFRAWIRRICQTAERTAAFRDRRDRLGLQSLW